MDNANIITAQGVRAYEDNGVAYINLEDAGRRLGFTQIAKSGNEVVRWERINGYLQEFGFIPTSGDAQKIGKESFIPENIFYRLAMKAKNAAGEKFQALVADEIIPSIRRTGSYGMAPAIPQDYPSALRALADQYEETMRLSDENKQLKLMNAAVESKNDLLVQKQLEWADRPFINSVVRKLALSYSGEYKEAIAKAWREYKKELLYREHINLDSRITKRYNATGKKPKTLDMITEDELPRAISCVVALSEEASVDISDLMKNVAVVSV